jgi:hypothetical protein
MAQALMQQSVIIGINWYNSFDNPKSDGTVAIAPGAQVRGGHEVQVLGMDPVANMFRAENSWGSSWGDGGQFQFSFDTMTRLLGEGGDCIVPLALGNAPTPTPTPPTPPIPPIPPTPPGPNVPALQRETDLFAVAGPWAQHHRWRSDLIELQTALTTWAQAAGLE